MKLLLLLVASLLAASMLPARHHAPCCGSGRTPPAHSAPHQGPVRILRSPQAPKKVQRVAPTLQPATK